ncbi:MAG: alanine racemase [Clostridia bacterium]|nr:alanine racemase [Clostridia bacterium]
MEDFLLKRAWAEVDLDAICHNYRLIRATLPKETKLCCVIKANAYGHGAVTLARCYEQVGADFLAVSNLSEALELRYEKIKLPILILGYTPPEAAKVLYENNISQCVFSPDYARSLANAARLAGVSVKAHIKVDTGMGRLGFALRREEDLPLCRDAIGTSLTDTALVAEGIFTHFASADEGDAGEEFTKEQLSLFIRLTEQLQDKGISFAIRHAANSAATLCYPEASLDMVRAGLVLYGIAPSSCVAGNRLMPALEVKTVISHIKTLSQGESVSYGRSFVADKAMRVATLPIGYADGLWRAAGSVGHRVWVCGRFVPIIGRICMDQCMIDVSDIPDAKEGDTVTVYGGAGERVASLAEKLGTIPYEILCAIGERIPRVYIENQKAVSVFDRILP